MKLRTLIYRALRLRCPRCGEGKLFSSWIKMPPECSHCGLKFDREPGYYLGSIYFNYGLTAVITMVLFFGLYFLAGIPAESMKWPLGIFCIVFPLWFFRYARSLWLGFDVFWDPTSEANAATKQQPAKVGD
jgi:uncharacterized protein (DUF983 family)